MKWLALMLAASCTTVAPRMSYRALDSRAMHKPMQYGVYTPPHWTSDERLPLVLFLHGGGDDVHCLEKEGIVAYLDREISAGRIPRVVMLVPEGDRGFWANWADGTRRYEDWVLREAVPQTVRDFGTEPCPGGCHVIGISMGGNGALRWVLAHPGLFRSAAVLSGPTLDAAGMKSLSDSFFMRTFVKVDRIFGPPTDERRIWAADPFQRWQSTDDLAGLRLLIAHGDADREGIAETNAALHRHLEAHGIAHQYVVFHGGHRWRDWEPLFGNALRQIPSPVPGEVPQRGGGASRHELP